MRTKLKAIQVDSAFRLMIIMNEKKCAASVRPRNCGLAGSLSADDGRTLQ